MNLEQLTAEIDCRAGTRDVTLSWIDKPDGSQVASAFAGGKLLCTWRATLVNPAVREGVTPRGPKDYHSVQFFDGEAKS